MRATCEIKAVACMLICCLFVMDFRQTATIWQVLGLDVALMGSGQRCGLPTQCPTHHSDSVLGLAFPFASSTGFASTVGSALGSSFGRSAALTFPTLCFALGSFSLCLCAPRRTARSSSRAAGAACLRARRSDTSASETNLLKAASSRSQHVCARLEQLIGSDFGPLCHAFNIRNIALQIFSAVSVFCSRHCLQLAGRVFKYEVARENSKPTPLRRTF